MTVIDILSNLPDCPVGYNYEIERVSPLVHRVWLHHEADYDYACGEKVKTVWGFIKGDKVYPPKNFKQMRAKSVCLLTDASSLSGYTSIIPKVTDLTHIL